jgi:DNA-binding beta-propeller fold protein YncE
VVDAGNRTVVVRVNIGLEPVSLAVPPDGKEVWVANHVSDSVSVIDADTATSSSSSRCRKGGLYFW